MSDDAIPAHGWKCNNCQTVFTSTQTERKEGDDNGGPNCPYCKAHGQYTYRYRLHQGDPCTGCGIAHDDVPPGPCVPTLTPIVTGSDERAREVQARAIAARFGMNAPSMAVRKAIECALAASRPTDAGVDEWTFTPDDREKTAILDLCADQELSPTAVMRQALRLYQADHLRRKDGETVTWSGDEQRARDFAGPLATPKPPVEEPWPGYTADQDKRRVQTLAKLGLMLSVMAGGEAAEVTGFDAFDLYADVLMALGIEDTDDPDIALQVARDDPEGHMLTGDGAGA